MKKVISLCLAIVMVLGLTTVAFAAGSTTITAKGNYQVDLVATVSKDPVLISVVMPTSIDFTVETTEPGVSEELVATKSDSNASKATATSGDGVYSNFISGTATVTNNSNGDIKLELVSAQDTVGDLLDQLDISLQANGVEDASINNTILLVDKKDYATAGDGELAASIGEKVAGTTNGDSVTLTVNGVEHKGKVTGDAATEYRVNIKDGSYTIQTMLKVSVA